ncbi:MAG: hypothetical protein IJZ75_06980 [Clostridia bacterium]|nr:hypothetical protein [Clostridia bacterium]
MKNCFKCGSAMEDKAVLCANCGTPSAVKKPVTKKWWFWVLIGFAVIVLIGSMGEDDSTSTNSDTNSKIESSEKIEQNSQPELTYEEEIATYGEIDFETLSRNPDKYKGEKFKFTGEVIQVLEASFGDIVELRINVTKQTYEYIDSVTWTDTIYATVELPDGEDRILEDDIITFYGECKGLYSYTSVLGSKISLPKIEIKYWNWSE